MNEFYKLFSLFFIRLRYPFSTPEDVGSDFGLNLTNQLSFQEFINCLTNPSNHPTKISKFMPRDTVENLFHEARHKEVFRHNTLISYYFNEGWMEFLLYFDENSKLRRVYICHKELKQKIEIPISTHF